MMPYDISCYCLSFMTMIDGCLHSVAPLCVKQWILHMQVWWVSDGALPVPFKMDQCPHLNMSQSFFFLQYNLHEGPSVSLSQLAESFERP